VNTPLAHRYIHYARPRISALFTDLDPSSSGRVRVNQLDESLVVSWKNVPMYGNDAENMRSTFQVRALAHTRETSSEPGLRAQADVKAKHFSAKDPLKFGICFGTSFFGALKTLSNSLTRPLPFNSPTPHTRLLPRRLADGGWVLAAD
jgi:hypothetical protein